MIQIELPFPPSVNHYWRLWRGRMVISQEGRAYRQRVVALLRAAKVRPMTGRLAVSTEVFPPDRRRRDLDNLFKAIGDSLQHGDAFLDDSQIVWLLIEKAQVVKGGKVTVRIWERHERDAQKPGTKRSAQRSAAVLRRGRLVRVESLPLAQGDDREAGDGIVQPGRKDASPSGGQGADQAWTSAVGAGGGGGAGGGAMSQAALQSPPMVLRPYQQEAVEAVYQHLRRRDDNPCVVLPTGSGKTPVIATICRDAVSLWGGRVLVLAHVKELLAQAVDKLRAICPDLWMQIGVYSAGLGSRDTANPIIVAGIQSVYQKAQQLGRFDMVLVDEAHMIPMDGDGMYRRFLEDLRQLNPHLRVVGLTATPFRLSSGPICVPPPEGILSAICYEAGVRELIAGGYLSPLRSKAGKHKANTDELHIRGGEFVAGEVEALMDSGPLVQSACREIVEQVRAGQRKSCLIFAASVKHGQHVAKVIEQVSGEECGFVDGESAGIFRDQIIGRFREGKLRYLANVNVLTTGFDAPGVDCVALLRPTMSPGLYYQMVGRGFRLAPGKTDCLVLDYGGNVLRHGPVDQIRIPDPGLKVPGQAPAKECPQCQALIALGYATCPDCGHEFPPPDRQSHDGTADSSGVLSGQVSIEEYPVRSTTYSVHVKRDAPLDAPRSMRVDYEVGYYQHKCEWVCLEHSGYARQKAVAWWKLRSCLPAPTSAEEAVALAEAGALAQTLSITVRSVAGEKYERIIDCELGAKPLPEDLAISVTADLEEEDGWDHSEPEEYPQWPGDEIPF